MYVFSRLDKVSLESSILSVNVVDEHDLTKTSMARRWRFSYTPRNVHIEKTHVSSKSSHVVGFSFHFCILSNTNYDDDV